MKRRRPRPRQRRVRPRQKGGMFHNGQLIVNKGINPRSWGRPSIPYYQRGSGGQKGGFLGPLGLGLGALFSRIGGGGRKRKQEGGNLSRFLSKKD